MVTTHDPRGRARKCSGDFMAAPPTTTTRKYQRNRINGQFAARLIEMLESPAFRALSLSGHRILARLEIELAHHGGNDNGRLPVTYDDFQAYGIDRHAIGPAIREVAALGFLEITQRGRAGNAEYRTPNMFRITYRPTNDAEPSDEWRRIKTHEEAAAIAGNARVPIKQARKAASKKKNKNQWGKIPSSVGGSLTERAVDPVLKTPTTAIVV